MAVYFYHFRTTQGALLEEYVGTFLANREAAIEEAVMAAAELGRGRPSPYAGGVFEVRDEAGPLVECVPVWRH